jgi:APA family basic amino acid/polyamine antiporter
VFGKIASIAAIAIVFQRYVFPQIAFWPSFAAIAILTLVNILGINRTALVATILSLTTVGFFATFSIMGIAIPGNLSNEAFAIVPENPVTSVLLGAGVVFFAFAGYARVATLGDEVRDSKRNIPRAIVVSLGFVMILYVVLAWVLVDGLGKQLQVTETPVAELFLILSGISWLTPVVAAAASLGSMLALLAGVSRTAASMAEDGELPKVFKLRNRFNAPWVAEVAVATGAIVLASIGEILWVIGFSSFSVLFYYSVGHLSAIAQPQQQRLTPVWLNYLGIVLCLGLAISFGIETFAISCGILGLAFASRRLWLSQRPR